ncbi:glycosyltransferase family 2 protein [Streptomyces coeruleorubidus]|uniref:glycosyltransferase family 2 protein n=1 Tax=Streptomyces coeruleorubidus TaxID=116188 RepID=UPI0033A90FCE
MTHMETGVTKAGGADRTAEWAAVEARIRQLSSGYVARITAAGPVFAQSRPSRHLRPDTFVPALTARDRATVAGFALSWAICFVWFWTWWLEPQHRVGWPGLIVNSALLLYVTVLPAYFLAMICRLRQVNPSLEIPAVPVAFVVTRSPSERWTTVSRTLEAMLAQDYPRSYDVWLCDEAPTHEIRAWCRGHGVHLSCRQGVPAYHRSSWPRRTRCKEGNLAYFYDHWGYRQYAVVAQLDCDHVPEPTYLAEMVRPFADPAVGYVAAPSICDANAACSWSARGRLYREAVWHGAVQLGHSGGLAPLCIGSHYAVRTAALRYIGGIGPELAEDFSTTFLLNAAGWQGAFAINAEAHGDGPLTFTDMVTQEYQWSRSLTTMLLDLLWDHVGRMPFLLRVRFICALGYYPTHGLVISLGLTLPPIAVIAGLPWMNVNLFEFLVHLWSMLVWLLLALVFMRRRGLLRPPSAPVVSWETWLFTLAGWPFVMWGVLAAVRQKIRPRPVDFKVTPKQRNGLEPLPARLVTPFVVMSLALAGAAVYGELTSPSVGYVFLCMVGAAAYATVAVAVPLLHVRETSRAVGTTLRAALATAPLGTLLGIASLLPLSLAVVFFLPYATAVLG